MAKNSNNNSKSNTGVGTAIGVSVVAAGLAGAYFLYGKRGKANRKKIRSWALRARAEVIDKIERIKNIDKSSYYKAIDDVVMRYAKLKEISRTELGELAQELKGHWGQIQKDLGSLPKSSTSSNRRSRKRSSSASEKEK